MLVVWKPVVGYEGLYEVSSIGLIRTIRREYATGEYGHTVIMEQKYMSLNVDDDGYYYVGLRKDRVRSYKRISRLVCEAFHPNPDNKPYVNHKDGIKKNNEPDNLEWSTISENELHSYKVLGKQAPKNGLGKIGKLNVRSKPLYQYDLSGNLVKKWESMNLAVVSGYNKRNLKVFLSGKWSHYRGFIWSRSPQNQQ